MALPAPIRAPKAAPLQRGDWIRAAFARLAQDGIDAVRVEVLARDLHASKGSFYWHFRDRDELAGAMLEQWDEDEPAWLAAAVADERSAAARWAELVKHLTDDAHSRLEAALRIGRVVTRGGGMVARDRTEAARIHCRGVRGRGIYGASGGGVVGDGVAGLFGVGGPGQSRPGISWGAEAGVGGFFVGAGVGGVGEVGRGAVSFVYRRHLAGSFDFLRIANLHAGRARAPKGRDIPRLRRARPPRKQRRDVQFALRGGKARTRGSARDDTNANNSRGHPAGVFDFLRTGDLSQCRLRRA